MALKIYVMLDVVYVGVVYLVQFDDAEDWQNEHGELGNDLNIAQMINAEANGEGEGYNGPAVPTCQAFAAPEHLGREGTMFSASDYHFPLLLVGSSA